MDIAYEREKECVKLNREIESLQNVLKRLQGYLLDERFLMIHEAGEVKSLGLMIDAHCIRIAVYSEILETTQDDN